MRPFQWFNGGGIDGTCAACPLYSEVIIFRVFFVILFVSEHHKFQRASNGTETCSPRLPHK